MLLAAERALRQLLRYHNIPGHGVDHMIAVAEHAAKALKFEQLTERQALQVELAALLHDADDPKLFKQSEGNPNARTILTSVGDVITDDKEAFINEVVAMINIVSCSAYGCVKPPEKWMAIPRDCDRLEAIGEIGIIRCREFAEHIGNPGHTADTPRAHTIEEVYTAAGVDRFNAYMKGVKSVSEIDHYYDKLLHIGQPQYLTSGNTYILAEAAARNEVMAKYVVEYWQEHQ